MVVGRRRSRRGSGLICPLHIRPWKCKAKSKKKLSQLRNQKDNAPSVLHALLKLANDSNDIDMTTVLRPYGGNNRTRTGKTTRGVALGIR